jgi:hypothetical protein
MVDHSSSNNKKRGFKGDIKHQTFIERVEEAAPCKYVLTVCSELTCTDEMKETVRKQMERNVPKDVKYQKKHEQPFQSKPQKGNLKDKGSPSVPLPSKPDFQYSFTSENNKPVSREEQEQLKKRVEEMFYHGYDSYMEHAYPLVSEVTTLLICVTRCIFLSSLHKTNCLSISLFFPKADLKPISCRGGKFELIKIPMVTLIDSLDTLVVLGNFSEFKRAVRLIERDLVTFDIDVNISVFETTIRILGGLLSAHLMAIDPKIRIYVSFCASLYTPTFLCGILFHSI